jgi:hypothetical protein
MFVNFIRNEILTIASLPHKITVYRIDEVNHFDKNNAVL